MQYGIVLKAKEWECVKLCSVAIIARHIPLSIIFLKETVIFKNNKKKGYCTYQMAFIYWYWDVCNRWMSSKNISQVRYQSGSVRQLTRDHAYEEIILFPSVTDFYSEPPTFVKRLQSDLSRRWHCTPHPTSYFGLWVSPPQQSSVALELSLCRDSPSPYPLINILPNIAKLQLWENVTDCSTKSYAAASVAWSFNVWKILLVA